MMLAQYPLPAYYSQIKLVTELILYNTQIHVPFFYTTGLVPYREGPSEQQKHRAVTLRHGGSTIIHTEKKDWGTFQVSIPITSGPQASSDLFANLGSDTWVPLISGKLTGMNMPRMWVRYCKCFDYEPGSTCSYIWYMYRSKRSCNFRQYYLKVIPISYSPSETHSNSSSESGHR